MDYLDNLNTTELSGSVNPKLESLRIIQADASWLPLSVHFLLFLVPVLFLVFVRRRYFSPLSHIPGPFLASFSRLWHLRQIWNGDQNLALIKAHDKYGHFVRMAHNEVSISHPDGIRRVLMCAFPKGDWYRIVSFPDYTFKAPFSMIDPKEAKEARKYLLTGYLHHNVLQGEPALDENIAKLLGWMDKYSEDKKPMDLAGAVRPYYSMADLEMHIDKFFSYTAFDITGEVLFSKPFGFLEKGEDVRNSIAVTMILETYVTFIGYFQWIHRLFANPFTTWLGILPMGHVFDTTMAALDKRQKNPDARFDLAAHWFRGLERAKKEGSKVFDLRILQAFATGNVSAGADTVSAGLQSFVYHLLRHPNGWQRIRAEIDAARKQGRCEGAVVSYEDACTLPYLQAALKEALRIFGPGSMGLPRVAPKGGVTVGDVTFPEGMTLTISPWVIHHSKELWGEDAREFNPDRWLQPDIAKKEKYFIPWGAGYASCPGQTVAKIQLLKIAASIVRDYDIRQVEPGKEWKWAAHFTVVPHDWPVYITKRADL
ncbi:hypothetical protein DL769_009907 [Monosporascus sp. CRB-8-3]|nr:hypothetical protein DL769_009907 [Monosporascus sp. CRB-8-3]